MFLLQVFSTVNEFFEQSAYKDQQLVKKSVESVTPRERVLGTRDAYYPVLGTRPLSMPTILLGTRDVEETRADGTRVSKQVTDVCFDLPLEKVLKRLFALCPDFLRIESRWYRALQMHRGGQSHGGMGGSYWFQHPCRTVSHDASRQKNKHKSLHFQSLHLTLFDSSDNGTSSRAYYRAKGRLGVSTEPKTIPIRPKHQIW